MSEATYKISFLEEIPSYVNKVAGRYPGKWAAARNAVQELAQGKANVVQVQNLVDKRECDLCKSAVYSETAKVRENGNPTFKTQTYSHETSSGKYELYAIKV